MRNILTEKKSAFTLSEVLITLVVVGVVAALTVPTFIAKYHEEQTVTRVKKIYSTLAQAFMKFQLKHACTNNINDCFNDIGGSYTNKKYYQDLEPYLNILDKRYPSENISDVEWLPEKNYSMNGNLNTTAWIGLWNFGSSSTMAIYALGDGSLLSIELGDGPAGDKCGFAFMDTNGKLGPNRIGKDQFPIGIGACSTTKKYPVIHPYLSEHQGGIVNGLCGVSGDKATCSPDICTQANCSPTAYVLKYDKLPPVNW